jgi:hypothetical protein
MMEDFETVRLAFAVKCGPKEGDVFKKKDLRGDYTTNLFAMRVPVVNAPGETMDVPIVRIREERSGQTVFTSLANTAYWSMAKGHAWEKIGDEAEVVPLKPELEEEPKKVAKAKKPKPTNFGEF